MGLAGSLREVAAQRARQANLTNIVSDNRGWIYTAVLVPLVAALGRWLWGWQQRRKQPGDPGDDEEAAAT